MKIEGAIRVGTKISKRANDWLDKKSVEMGIPKSALISIAVESYIKDTDVVQGFPALIKALEEHGISIDN